MKQSKKLTKFYRALSDAYYLHQRGKKTPDWFLFDEGICHNLDTWSDHDNELDDELGNQFKQAGLCRGYPFGENNYYKINDKTKDKNRIRWTNKHLSRNVKRKFKLK